MSLFAIIAATELLKYLVTDTGQKIVIYTDSLTAIKTLDINKEFDSGLADYSRLRSNYYKIITDNNLDISLKKVPAHSGYEFNELADVSAKRRLSTMR